MVRIAKEMAADIAKGLLQTLFAVAMLALPGVGVAVGVGVWFLMILFFGV